MTRVFVGRLSFEARERDLEDLFKTYGEIRGITVKSGYGFIEFADSKDAEDSLALSGTELLGGRINVELAKPRREDGGYDRQDRGDRYDRDRRSDRYDRDDRDRYRDRGDRYDRDRRSSRDRERRSDRYRDDRRSNGYAKKGFRVIAENLAYDVSWQDLKDFAKSAKVEVTFTDAHKIKRGEGVIEFPTESDMDNAIKELDGVELKGRKVYFRRDNRHNEERSSRRDRSLSRSRSPPRRRRSRSRSESSERPAKKQEDTPWAEHKSPENSTEQQNGGDNPWAPDTPEANVSERD